MKTDDLINLLSTGEEPVRRRVVARHFFGGIALGVTGSLVLMLLGYGVRPDWVHAMYLPMFWLKFFFPAACAALGMLLLWRLVHPGRRWGIFATGLGWLALAMMLVALIVLLNAPSAERSALIFGATWKECSLSIAFIALPVFWGSLYAARAFAPTQPALTGAAAGLVSGAVGAFIYALHCPEMQAPFLASWYSLGMLLPAFLGYVLGPMWLRW